MKSWFHLTKTEKKIPPHGFDSVSRNIAHSLIYASIIGHPMGRGPRQIQLCMGLTGGLERLFYPGGGGIGKVWFTTSFHCGKNWWLCKRNEVDFKFS